MSVLLILYVYVGIVSVSPLALSAAVVSELAQTHSVVLALCICCMNPGNWHQSVIMLWIGVVPGTVIVLPCVIAHV